jgi:hypothetical protein
MAEGGDHGLLRVPRGAYEQSGTWGIPTPRHQAMVAHASAAQPEGPDDVGADRDDRCTLASYTPNPSSMAAAAFCRHAPEVGAVCPNRARTDLSGGRPVMGVPTAIFQRGLTRSRSKSHYESTTWTIGRRARHCVSNPLIRKAFPRATVSFSSESTITPIRASSFPLQNQPSPAPTPNCEVRRALLARWTGGSRAYATGERPLARRA